MSASTNGQHHDRNIVTDVILELQTVPHFVQCAFSGIMPQNKKTTLTTLSLQEVAEYYGQDYSIWARRSHRELSSSPNTRIMSLLASCDHSSRLVVVDVGLDVAKSKIWEGLSLVSDARWTTKRLDDQEKINDALDYIRYVISVFDYLRKPIIQGIMRETYNLVYKELEIFQDAINVIRGENGDAQVQVTALWSEFMKAHFETMAQHARAWIFKRLKSLRAIWKGRIFDVFLSGRLLNSTQRTVRVDHMALAVYQNLLDLGIEADRKVRVRTNGMIGISPRDESELSREGLERVYKEKEIEATQAHNLQMLLATRMVTANRRSVDQTPYPEFAEQILVIFDQESAHMHLLPEVGEYPSNTLSEPWILEIQKMNAQNRNFGFVAYRVSYEDNAGQWAAFLMKLNTVLNASWSGFSGSEDIKGDAKLQWIDGKQENIAEGDLDGVRKHFAAMSQSERILPGMDTTICLAIDEACIQAFNASSGSSELRKGTKADFRGYVWAVDSAYDAATFNHEDSPGYAGKVKILDQCVMTDLYAILHSQCYSLDEIWRVAKEHPWQVYVGPTIRSEKEAWKEIKKETAGMLGNLVQLALREDVSRMLGVLSLQDRR